GSGERQLVGEVGPAARGTGRHLAPCGSLRGPDRRLGNILSLASVFAPCGPVWSSPRKELTVKSHPWRMPIFYRAEINPRQLALLERIEESCTITAYYKDSCPAASRNFLPHRDDRQGASRLSPTLAAHLQAYRR